MIWFTAIELLQNGEFVDENGIRTTVEYTLNDDGKKVKVRILSLEFEPMNVIIF